MKLYVDTNVLYLVLRPPAADDPLNAWVRECQHRFARGSDEAVVCPLVLDELAYRLLLAALRDDGAREPLVALRADAGAVVQRHGDQVARLVGMVAALPGVSVARIDAARSHSALEYMTAYRLLPRDAMHLSVAVAEGCQGILSLDGDFARASEVVPWLGPPSQPPPAPTLRLRKTRRRG